MKKSKKFSKLTAAILSAALIVSAASAAPSAKAYAALAGDIDSDGKVTSADALTVLRMSVSSEAKTAAATHPEYDVDRDGAVTSGDALMILRESVGFGDLSKLADENRETQDQGTPERNTVENGISDFSAAMFKGCAEENEGKSIMVSPLSAYIALSMLNNGSSGLTREQMTDVLSGSGSDLSAEEINSFMNGYITEINKNDVFNAANSIFVMKRDDVTMNEGFLDTIHGDYQAEIFNELPNNDTVDKINDWVKLNTKGMIDKIAEPDSLTPETVALLLNAVSFKSGWVNPYWEGSVKEDTFHNYDGSEKTVEFLTGTEDLYVEDGLSTGFVKRYDSGYEFIAILPKENISVDEYISSIDGNTIRNLRDHAIEADVRHSLPKFSADCTLPLSTLLKEMGMGSAFDPKQADFSELAVSSLGDNIYVNSVTQKTHIKLDEKGTEAAAVTVIDVVTDAMPEPLIQKEITLDRPFVYVIYDRFNKIPLFIGTVCGF